MSPVIVEILYSLSEVLYRALSLRAAALIAGILLTLQFFMLIMTAANHEDMTDDATEMIKIILQNYINTYFIKYYCK